MIYRCKKKDDKGNADPINAQKFNFQYINFVIIIQATLLIHIFIFIHYPNKHIHQFADNASLYCRSLILSSTDFIYSKPCASVVPHLVRQSKAKYKYRLYLLSKSSGKGIVFYENSSEGLLLKAAWYEFSRSRNTSFSYSRSALSA